MNILTSRFGEIEIDEQSIISLPGGLIGFPEQERYVIISHSPDSPFFWLQAVDSQDLAFVIVDPQIFKADYEVPLTAQTLQLLQAESRLEVGVYVIVTIPRGNPQGMTANLLGPLVLNAKSRLARQLVLDESRYSHRHPILRAEGQAKMQTRTGPPGNEK
ncbi:MAG: flagellar assembly protein FliW [Pseudomonadota bacterium]